MSSVADVIAIYDVLSKKSNERQQRLLQLRMLYIECTSTLDMLDVAKKCCEGDDLLSCQQLLASIKTTALELVLASSGEPLLESTEHPINSTVQRHVKCWLGAVFSTESEDENDERRITSFVGVAARLNTLRALSGLQKFASVPIKIGRRISNLQKDIGLLMEPIHNEIQAM